MKSIHLVLILCSFTSIFCQGPYLVYGPSGGDLESIYAKPSNPFPAPVAHRQPYAYSEPMVPVSVQKMKYQRQYAPSSSNDTSEEAQVPVLTLDPRDPDGDSILGLAGQDYPILSEIPKTEFQCSLQKNPGYYADQEALCQVFHICQDDGRNSSFLCPNGTIFNQKYFVCDWWYNVNCSEASAHFDMNVAFAKVTESTLPEETDITTSNAPDLLQPQVVPPEQDSYGSAPRPGLDYYSYGTRYAKPQQSQNQQSYPRPQEMSFQSTYSQLFNPNPEIEVDLH